MTGQARTSLALAALAALLAAVPAAAQVNPYGSSGDGNVYGLDLAALRAPDGSGARVAIVMDFSGSMAGQTGSSAERSIAGRVERGIGNMIGGRTGGEVSQALRERRQKAKEAIRNVSGAIAGLSEDTLFNVITFESRPHPWRPDMVQATEDVKDDAEDYLDDLEPSGGTAMIPALETAFEMAPHHLVLVSDGEPNEGARAVLDRVRELNQDGAVTVHAIGIGEDHDEAFMRDVAEQNGGEYHARGAGPI
jgi:Mg-chelatase subunit ChlD